VLPFFLRKSGFQKGFSTPELLMTIVVFSFGLLPLIVLFQKSHKVTAQAKNLMVAQSLGRTLIDEFRSYGFEGIKKYKDKLIFTDRQVKGPVLLFDPDFSDDKGIQYPPYYSRFLVTSQISQYPDSPAQPEKFTICLTIKWTEPGREGGIYSLAFGTVVVKYGPK